MATNETNVKLRSRTWSNKNDTDIRQYDAMHENNKNIQNKLNDFISYNKQSSGLNIRTIYVTSQFA